MVTVRKRKSTAGSAKAAKTKAAKAKTSKVTKAAKTKATRAKTSKVTKAAKTKATRAKTSKVTKATKTKATRAKTSKVTKATKTKAAKVKTSKATKAAKTKAKKTTGSTIKTRAVAAKVTKTSKAKRKPAVQVSKDKKIKVTKSTRKKTTVKKAKSKRERLDSSVNAEHYLSQDFTPYAIKAGEEYMCDAQRDHFKSLLIQRKNELLVEADRTLSHLQNETGNFPDPIDQAAYQEKFTLELRTRDRDYKLILKINDALERIARHDYGYCDECGAEIGVRRLEVRPTAVLCIDCKTFDEIKERQTSAD